MIIHGFRLSNLTPFIGVRRGRAVDRPEDPGLLPRALSGHVLSETAGAMSFGASLNSLLRIGGGSQGACIDGEDRFLVAAPARRGGE